MSREGPRPAAAADGQTPLTASTSRCQGQHGSDILLIRSKVHILASILVITIVLRTNRLFFRLWFLIGRIRWCKIAALIAYMSGILLAHWDSRDEGTDGDALTFSLRAAFLPYFLDRIDLFELWRSRPPA